MLRYSVAARKVAIQCERPLPPSTRLTLQGTRADAALNSRTAPLLSVPTADVTKENPPPHRTAIQRKSTVQNAVGTGEPNPGVMPVEKLIASGPVRRPVYRHLGRRKA